MKLGVSDIIALVKAGYKMSDIKALQEEKQEEKTEEKQEEKQEEKTEEKQEEKQEEKTEEKQEEKTEEKPEEKPEEKRPTVADLKNQIRDLTAQIKSMQEANKESDVSHNKDTKKPTDNELMLDLFRTFM